MHESASPAPLLLTTAVWLLQDGDKENSDAVAEDSGGMADGGVAEDTAMKEAS